MSISTIEDKLYHSNFKSEDLRLKSYLAVHATLLKSKEIPRVFIPSGSVSQQKAEDILNNVLYSDVCLLTEATNKHLASLNISTKSIHELNSDEKNELLSLVEDLIFNGWGSGKVHYEYLRIAPYNSCELLKWINAHCKDLEHFQGLIETLEKREAESITFQNEMNKYFSPGNRRYHPTVLAKSYQLLIEKQWRNNWTHQNNYLFDGERSVTNLLLLEDL